MNSYEQDDRETERLRAMTQDELVAAYNGSEHKPNSYGQELLRRINLRDQEEAQLAYWRTR